jgi:hypothetical protein
MRARGSANAARRLSADVYSGPCPPILSEYDKWAKKHPGDAAMMGGFRFFRYLQNERSDLLDFRVVGDKWQIVHSWLRGRLED